VMRMVLNMMRNMMLKMMRRGLTPATPRIHAFWQWGGASRSQPAMSVRGYYRDP
jgi:hypothetical protein